MIEIITEGVRMPPVGFRKYSVQFNLETRKYNVQTGAHEYSEIVCSFKRLEDAKLAEYNLNKKYYRDLTKEESA